jgi:GNAT superfamily N-acetyltransferase
MNFQNERDHLTTDMGEIEILTLPPEQWQRYRELIFAEQGGRLIGMIGAFRDKAQVSAHIVSVYVSKAARGKGVGRALMQAILAEVGKVECIHTATLGVNQEQTAAVALYRRFGFVVASETEELQGAFFASVVPNRKQSWDCFGKVRLAMTCRFGCQPDHGSPEQNDPVYPVHPVKDFTDPNDRAMS